MIFTKLPIQKTKLIKDFQKNNFSTLIFAGQGTQKIGMTKQYEQQNPEKYEKICSEINEKLQYNIKELMQNGPLKQLNQTEFTQPAIFTNQLLSYELNKEYLQKNYDIKTTIGNSVGEYAALYCAGILPDYLQIVKILQKRGQLMQKACQNQECGMLAITSGENEFQVMKFSNKVRKDFPEQKMGLALFNSNQQVVFSGNKQILQEFNRVLKEEKIPSIFLKLQTAFHSEILSPVKEEFQEFLQQNLTINDPSQISIKTIKNYDGEIYDSKESVIEGLVQQFDRPVLFYQSIAKNLIQQKERQFIEIGETNVVGKFVDQIGEQFGIQDDLEIISFKPQQQ
ncbi:Acyl transferase/acyl hydrolase/lysophospholipase [Pseudocohnilembus persalinus]|uniref:[acyl-carrier-protein] S-malonyltransferase n=1 Tax=Pseudocohnilembus persalinus TaxID=266149 RepID=A0A0V0QIM4_PSEPJ|nr:Acyl transferase/acyl hydrolase/lysophospholipase [Pseudocohnilembus persalinus]|eukprot:KRX01944.1 Acyl transferase/acyl hydrolase/lysophospholipase [Pseudocohnilembus persalinus]